VPVLKGNIVENLKNTMNIQTQKKPSTHASNSACKKAPQHKCSHASHPKGVSAINDTNTHLRGAQNTR